jgi:hypothetical protein
MSDRQVNLALGPETHNGAVSLIQIVAPFSSRLSRNKGACIALLGLCYRAGMAPPNPQHLRARMMPVLGFVGIAIVSFAAGWLAGTMLIGHVRLI